MASSGTPSTILVEYFTGAMPLFFKSAVRVRIHESDLPLALRIIENTDVFSSADAARCEETHSIIVPTDFSDYSLRAAAVAGRLAAAHGASLRLLHAYIDPYVAANMQLSDRLTYEIADSDTRERLETAAKTIYIDGAHFYACGRPQESGESVECKHVCLVEIAEKQHPSWRTEVLGSEWLRDGEYSETAGIEYFGADTAYKFAGFSLSSAGAHDNEQRRVHFSIIHNGVFQCRFT